MAEAARLPAQKTQSPAGGGGGRSRGRSTAPPGGGPQRKSGAPDKAGPAVKLGGGPDAASRPQARGPAQGGPQSGPAEAGPDAAAGPAVTLSSPEQDPRFQETIAQLEESASNLKQHDPASQKAEDAQAAAKAPDNEGLSEGQAQQLKEMQGAETSKPEEGSFLALLEAEIIKTVPPNVGKIQNFMQGSDRTQLKGTLKSNVKEQENKSTAGLRDATQKTPQSISVAEAPRTLGPVDNSPKAKSIDSTGAVPTPNPNTEAEFAEVRNEADQLLTDNDLTEKQLRQANEPPFTSVLEARDEVHTQTQSGLAQYSEREQQILSGATVQATNLGAGGLANLAKGRGLANLEVHDKQNQSKMSNTETRESIVNQINTLYKQTDTNVKNILKGLRPKVIKIFDQGVDAAISQMRSYIGALFKERYGGFLGTIRDLGDSIQKLFNQPLTFEKVWFKTAHRNFITALKGLIRQVAKEVETTLNEAKKEIDRGEKAVRKFVEKDRPSNLKAVALKAEKDIKGSFNKLRQNINSQKRELVKEFAQRYHDAVKRGEKALEEEKNKPRTTLDRLENSIKEAVKILTEFRDKLMAVFSKGEATIKLILENPIGFLGNLLAAAKGGIQAFLSNIWTHLKRGFMQWLFGSLAKAGIEIPSDLSLVSIFKLVMSVLGITYARMRAKAVKLIGERNVRIIEKLVEYLRTLISGGPAALWEMVKGDLANLKAMVIDTIQNWLIETAITKGAGKLAAMFTPAGAFVQALITIYNTGMFLIQKAQQLASFAQSLINSVHAIATGAIGGAIAKVEQSLGQAIHIAIGFLASLAGLGDISDKIRGFIQKVQGVVDVAIDKAIAKVVQIVKKLFSKGQDDKPDERTEEQKKADLNKAIEEGTSLLQNPKLSTRSVKKKLPAIRKHYRLHTLEVITKDSSGSKELVHIRGSMSPPGDGEVVEKPKGMELTTINFEFTPKEREGDFIFESPESQMTEYRGQLQAQEAGLNSMTIKVWEENKTVARKEGKNAAARQRTVLKNVVKKEKEKKSIDPDKLAKETELLSDFAERHNFTGNFKELKKKIRDKDLELAALHRVDQVAGGKHDDFFGFGDSRINSSIGASWNTGGKVQKIKNAIEGIPDEVKAKENINVKLTLNGS